MKKWGCALLALLLLGQLAGCGKASAGAPSLPLAPPAKSAQSGTAPSPPQAPKEPAGKSTVQTVPAAQAVPSVPLEAPSRPCLFNELAAEAVAALELTGEEDSFEKIRLAYRYVIQGTVYIPFDDELLTGSWRYLDRCGAAPTAFQVMAASPLLYGIGSCENYACALMLLLEELGFETRYVSGLTYSVSGNLVDHAWAMVQVSGLWYHIDPQLEDNVLRQNTLSYRYYLKSDEDFAAHHLWGKRLPNPDAYGRQLPECSRPAPGPAAEELIKKPAASLEEAQWRAGRLKETEPAPITPAPARPLPPFPGAMEEQHQ